jgi:hypothetical protein
MCSSACDSSNDTAHGCTMRGHRDGDRERERGKRRSTQGTRATHRIEHGEDALHARLPAVQRVVQRQHHAVRQDEHENRLVERDVAHDRAGDATAPRPAGRHGTRRGCKGQRAPAHAATTHAETTACQMPDAHTHVNTDDHRRGATAHRSRQRCRTCRQACGAASDDAPHTQQRH